ncbi:hypothetical protein BH11MYX3_BH11MYX3_00980 [soil metagenome]
MAIACVLVARVAHAEPSEDELIGVITMQPRSDRAEAYVDLLLDRLNRAGRREELAAWIDRMLAMPQLLRGRAELVERLRKLQVSAWFARSIELQKAAHRSGLPEDWRMAARSYLLVASLARTTIAPDSMTVSDGLVSATIVDETTYNAAICFNAAGDRFTALATFEAVTGSSLAPFAHTWMLKIVLRAPLAILTD